ncbi:putative metallopeptidase [Spirochaetota bacterium]
MHYDVINITKTINQIIYEISNFSNNFSHINPEKVLVCISSNKKNYPGGTYGKLVPLRFEGGEETLKYQEKYYSIPSIFLNGKKQLYIIYFYMPKFFDLSYKEKINIIFHELYHINPEFNGDIRRISKVKSAHGYSKKQFDLKYKRDIDSFNKYILQTPYLNFLKMDSRFLFANYKKVIGRRMKKPKPMILEY